MDLVGAEIHDGLEHRANVLLQNDVLEPLFVPRLLVEAVGRRDYPLIQGVILVTSLIFVLANLLVDVVYVIIDPRIRYE